MIINWGVVGAGGIADRRTIPEGIMAADGARLVAVADVDATRASQVGAKYGAAWYTDPQLLLTRSDIDAVYIATPVAHHYQLILAAARQGKHILCEKPLTLTVDQGEKAIAVCNQQGVKLAVGYMMRFHGAHQKLKAMLDSHELGQPVLARAQLTCWYPPIAGAWRQDLAQGGGGALMDMATHCIDLLEMFFGPVDRVMADVGTITHNYAVDDSALVMLHFRNGAKAEVDSNFNIPDLAATNVLEVYGTKGSVIGQGTIGQGSGGTLLGRIAHCQGGYDAKQERAIKVEEIAFTAVNTYRAEVEDLMHAIRTGGQPTVDGLAGLHNLRLALAAYQSAEWGRVVDVA